MRSEVGASKMGHAIEACEGSAATLAMMSIEFLLCKNIATALNWQGTALVSNSLIATPFNHRLYLAGKGHHLQGDRDVSAGVVEARSCRVNYGVAILECLTNRMWHETVYGVRSISPAILAPCRGKGLRYARTYVYRKPPNMSSGHPLLLKQTT